MKKSLFFITMVLMAVIFNGCKNKNNAENLLVGNWVVIGAEDEYNYTMRFEGVEFYLNFQDNGTMVQYFYSGEYTESAWENGVLSGESWTPYESYTWKSDGNTISFSPEFWGINQAEYKKVSTDIIEIEGVIYGRVKQMVTIK